MTPENTMALSLKIVRAQGPRNFYNPINFLGCENFTQNLVRGIAPTKPSDFCPYPARLRKIEKLAGIKQTT